MSRPLRKRGTSPCFNDETVEAVKQANGPLPFGLAFVVPLRYEQDNEHSVAQGSLAKGQRGRDHEADGGNRGRREKA